MGGRCGEPLHAHDHAIRAPAGRPCVRLWQTVPMERLGRALDSATESLIARPSDLLWSAISMAIHDAFERPMNRQRDSGPCGKRRLPFNLQVSRVKLSCPIMPSIPPAPQLFSALPDLER